MPLYKTKVKKDGLQQYLVRVNYTDSFGKAHSLTRHAYGLAKAKQMEQDIIREYCSEKPAVTRMTVQQLYDEYIVAKGNEVRATSLVPIKNCLAKGTLPYLADKRLDKLTVPTLQSWKNDIAMIDVSISTKQNYYAELRQMLNYAVKMGYIPKNNLTIVGNFKKDTQALPKEELHFYTPDQFKKFIAAAREQAEKKDTINDWSYYVFFCIAYFTGARKGEIYALKWSDIKGHTLSISRSVNQKVGRIVETLPKNSASIRTLQIPMSLEVVLNEQKERQMQDENFTEDYRICGGIDCIRDSTVCNKGFDFADKAGLPHIRLHDFRHSHASLLASEGINIQEIARRLGHSNVEMTWNTYSHLYPHEEERAVSVLDKIFLK